MNPTPQYLFGLHAVLALLQKQPDRIIDLYVHATRQDDRIHEVIQLAQKHSISIHHVTRQKLDQLTNQANHQGVAVFILPRHSYSLEEIENLMAQSKALPPLILVLDGIQDPHNLGACFRTADAASVCGIIAPKHQSVGLTGVVSKVASGAVETVPFIQVTNLVRALEMLKTLDIWIYGASLKASQTLYQMDFTHPTAIVLGSEGTGLRRLTAEHCDELFYIPMLGSVQSLNVSVATGICLFEAQRQRQRISHGDI